VFAAVGIDWLCSRDVEAFVVGNGDEVAGVGALGFCLELLCMTFEIGPDEAAGITAGSGFPLADEIILVLISCSDVVVR
jgi:hypothetical protein